MRKYIPGLHSGQQDLVSNLDGLFLVRVERASYRWHPQNPFLALRFSILEPTSHEAISFSHSGIRFPQNGCVSCAHLGLCLDDQTLINSSLIRAPGASDLEWLDQLVD